MLASFTHSNSVCVTPGMPIETLDIPEPPLMTEGRMPTPDGLASILDVVEPFLDIGSMATDLRGIPVDRVFPDCTMKVGLWTVKKVVALISDFKDTGLLCSSYTNSTKCRILSRSQVF